MLLDVWQLVGRVEMWLHQESKYVDQQEPDARAQVAAPAQEGVDDRHCQQLCRAQIRVVGPTLKHQQRRGRAKPRHRLHLVLQV